MLFHQRNYSKLVRCWKELGMNQMEIKETRIEFLINNSRVQSNNFKMNIKLNVEEICRDCRFDFL